jgi:hypothetical protein
MLAGGDTVSPTSLSNSSANNSLARVLTDGLAQEGWTDIFPAIEPEQGGLKTIGSQ